MKARNGVLVLLLSVIVPLAGLPVFAGAPAIALTFRMAANVPANSPWDLGLKRLAAEFSRVSGGQANIVFPQSAHVSTESDIIQKMRFGIVGALLTTFGLAELYPTAWPSRCPASSGTTRNSMPYRRRRASKSSPSSGNATPSWPSRREDGYAISPRLPSFTPPTSRSSASP